MIALTATEVSRNFSRCLDNLARSGTEIVIVRNKQPVARLVPGTPRMNAQEFLGDLYATLSPDEGAEWLDDIRNGQVRWGAEVRDPWA